MRVRTLIAAGIITKFTISVDNNLLGHNHLVFIRINLKPGFTDQVTEELSNMEEVLGDIRDIIEKKIRRLPKVLSSGDRISAEYKFQNSFEFEPHAKLIFSANRLPLPDEDIDDASYYKRWIIIEFALREYCFFCGKNIVMDRDLIDKLITEEELSGLLNVVLIGARRLLARRRFVKSPSSQEVKRKYQALADPVKAWIDERCVLAPQHNVDKNLLHSDFINYCWDKKLKRLELNALGRELAKYGIRDRQVGSDKQHVWSGIALKGGEECCQ